MKFDVHASNAATHTLILVIGFCPPESVWNSEKLYLLVPLVKLRRPLKQFLKVKAMKKGKQRVMMKPLKLNLTMSMKTTCFKIRQQHHVEREQHDVTSLCNF